LTKRYLFILIWVLTVVLPGVSAQAQDELPTGPVYVVQAGDTLWDIARRFGVVIDDLLAANGLTLDSFIKPGDELVIPGLAGLQGRLETRPMPFGETLLSLSRLYQVPIDTLARLNRVVAPSELFVGLDLIIPLGDTQPGSLPLMAEAGKASLIAGQSMLELSASTGTNPWTLVLANNLAGLAQVTPQDTLRLPGQLLESPSPGGLTASIRQAELQPQVVAQGHTLVIRLQAPPDVKLSGSLLDHDLNFFYQETAGWVALQGIHAMTEPGLYSLNLQMVDLAGNTSVFSQRMRVDTGNYPFDPVLIVDPATIDPEVTQPENEQWNALAAPVSDQKYWEGRFSSPVAPEFSDCFPSRFGNRRSYNDGGYFFFHTGLDFCGAVGNQIFAPAAGVIIFAGPLAVRGSATMIDHGWGIYTAYMHQSEIFVSAGQAVQPGDLIGLVGNTGRVTGPHLHWEVWAGGVQVDPLDWLQIAYP
jgi:murein DD-endopeptidase MepM/ murein hydrolase activator NlpD